MPDALDTTEQELIAVPGGVRPLRVVTAAVAVGVAAEWLVHDTVLHGASPGLGFALAALAMGLVLGSGQWATGAPPGRSARLLLGMMGFFSAMVALRASPELTALNGLTVLALGVGAVYLYRGRSLADVALGEYVTGGVAATFGSLAGPARLADAHRVELPRLGAAASRGAPLLRGVLLALVPLVVFGLLFASADAVFAEWVGLPFSVRLSSGLAQGALLAFAIAWVAAGALYHAAEHEDWPEPVDLAAPRRIGAVETAVVLCTVNAMFLLFVAIQFAYLFGGAATVRTTGGLTYAEYARRGFFELLAVAGLVTVLVLVVDWWSGEEGAARPAATRRLLAVLLALTGVVLTSASVRLAAYVDEFGLSKIRLYAAAVMIWVALLLGWLALTALRGHSRRFPVRAFVAGLAVLAVLNIANPDALIARVNVDRHLDGTRTLDVGYLAGNLSADAVPTLVGALDRLDPCTALDLHIGLAAVDLGSGDWRSFNVGRARAESALDRRPPPPEASC